MDVIRVTLWRLLRFHPLTWLVGLIVGAVLVLITVPGTEWDPHAYHHVDHQWHDFASFDAYVSVGGRFNQHRSSFRTHVEKVYAHGWPLTSVVRARAWRSFKDQERPSEPLLRFDYPEGLDAPFGPYYHGVSWSNYDNWPFRSEYVTVHYGYLAVNILVAVAILAGATTAAELWVRRRGGLFRFRILDLMVGVAIVAGMLGYRQWHLNCQRAEMDLVNELELVNDGNGYFFVDAFSAGPEWLVRLVGNEELVPYFVRHVAVVEFALLGPEKIKRLEELPYLKGVCVSAPLSREEIEALWGVRRLEYLDLSYHGNGWGYKEGGPLRLSRPASPTSSEIEALCKLPIITLKLHAPALTLSGLEQLVTCPTLRTLHLHRADISPEEIEGVRRRHPDLRIVSQSE